MSDTKQLTLSKLKSTKNTDVYETQTEGEPPVFTTLYVQKWWSKGAETLTVSITKDTEE